MRNIPVSLEEDAVKTLDAFAEKHDVPRAQVMRKALDLGFPLLFEDPSKLESERAPTKGRKVRGLTSFEEDELHKLLVMVDPRAAARHLESLLQAVITDVVEATDRKHGHVLESGWDPDQPETGVFRFRPVDGNNLDVRALASVQGKEIKLEVRSSRAEESLDIPPFFLDNIKLSEHVAGALYVSSEEGVSKTCLGREIKRYLVSPSEMLLACISDVLVEALRCVYPWVRGRG